MKPRRKSFVLFIILLWSVYAAWAMDMQDAIKSYSDNVFRYDLWLLPFLILFTAVAVRFFIRKQSSDNTQDTDNI